MCVRLLPDSGSERENDEAGFHSEACNLFIAADV